MLPAIEEIDTTRPSPEAFSIGAKVRMVANWPRQLTANMRSISSSSSASRSACGTGLVKPAALTRTCRVAVRVRTAWRSAEQGWRVGDVGRQRRVAGTGQGITHRRGGPPTEHVR